MPKTVRRRAAIPSAPRIGRPSAYRPEYDDRAFKQCLRGATDKDLARHFGVGATTIEDWLNRYPSFLESVNNGRENADANVAVSLYQRATGCSIPATKIFLHEGKPVRVPYVEHYPPDTAAAFIWLKNRQPGLWRDRKDVSLTGPDGGPVQVRHITSRVIDADYTDITDAVVEAAVGDETERGAGADNAPRLPATISTKAV